MATTVGLTIAPVAPVTVAAPPSTAPDPATLTNPQLAEMCRARGIAVPRKATKAQLLALLGVA